MEEQQSPASTETPAHSPKEPTSPPAAASSSPAPEKPKKSTVQLTKVLPSDRLTADRQIDAVRAFAAVAESTDGKQPISNEKAGDVIKMAAGTIVVTNAFFCDVGLLTRVDGGFLVSQEVIAFLRAESGLSPEAAPEKLRPLFEKQWFMHVLTPRLRLAPMDIGAVQKVIGEECSASKDHLGRIDVLIDFLCFVKCLAREGNQLRLVGSSTLRMEMQPLANPQPAAASAATLSATEPEDEGLEKYTLTLNAAQKRKIYLWAPPEITAVELKRLQQWLSFQLIVTDADNQT
jgi:hypothetical protein